MQLKLLKCKLHRAKVTDADLDYEGSIGIDSDLMEAAGIIPFEHVEVYDITNGSRFTTYAIPLPKGSGEITINGAAAHLSKPGDLVIICAFVFLTKDEVHKHQPNLVLVDEKNKVKRITHA